MLQRHSALLPTKPTANPPNCRKSALCLASFFAIDLLLEQSTISRVLTGAEFFSVSLEDTKETAKKVYKFYKKSSDEVKLIRRNRGMIQTVVGFADLASSHAETLLFKASFFSPRPKGSEVGTQA